MAPVADPEANDEEGLEFPNWKSVAANAEAAVAPICIEDSYCAWYCERGLLLLPLLFCGRRKPPCCLDFAGGRGVL